MTLPHFQRLPNIPSNTGSTGSTSWVQYEPIPNPTELDLQNPIFESIFQVIKDWDIKIPKYYYGAASGNGSHVKLIMDSLIPVMRDEKINEILK